MNSTGVVRKLDNLGRIVIPIELRKTMGIAIKDTLEIFTEGDEIILKKYQPGCIFCQCRAQRHALQGQAGMRQVPGRNEAGARVKKREQKPRGRNGRGSSRAVFCGII